VPLSFDDAWAYHQTGRLDEAAEVYAELLRAQPDCAEVLHLLGNIEYRKGNPGRAIDLIEKAIECDSGSAVYRISLGHVHRRSGNLQAAGNCYRAALEGAPASMLAATSLAKVLTGQARLEEAAELLQRVLALDSRYLPALNELGDLCMQLERYAEAAQLYQRSLAIEPQDARIHFCLGVASNQLGDETAAVACFHASLQCRSDFIEACYNLGVIDAERQQFATAEAWFRRALDIDPAYVDARINLSGVLQKAGRVAEARVFRDQAYRQQCIFTRISRSAVRTVLILFDAGTGNMNLSYLLSRRHNNMIDWMIEYAPEGQRLPPFDLVFNAMGDQDQTGSTTVPAARFLRTCTSPVLNRPEVVARTSRDRIPELLAGIDGLHVPRTWRVEGHDWPDEIDQHLPVLVRPLDSHGGAGLQLLHNQDELDSFKVGTTTPHYVTAFCDYRSPDGYFRKYRIIFIDRQPLPYHLAISLHWVVHYATAGMPGVAWKIDEERRFLEDPAAVLGPRAYAAIKAIGARMELDYAGVDFSLLPDGRVLLFEANPVMLVHPEPESGALAHKNPYISRIFDAFEELLARAQRTL